MSTFNIDKWKSRAVKRFNAAIDNGKSASVATRKFSDDIKHIEALNTTITWCTKRGVKVIFGRTAPCFVPETKVIMLNATATPMQQLFFLLHETGHMLIGTKNERFAMGYRQSDPSVTKTFRHKLDIIDEEFEAWDRGWRLSKRLGLQISRDEYQKLRCSSMKTYLKWGLNIDGYRPADEK